MVSVIEYVKALDFAKKMIRQSSETFQQRARRLKKNLARPKVGERGLVVARKLRELIDRQIRETEKRERRSVEYIDGVADLLWRSLQTSLESNLDDKARSELFLITLRRKGIYARQSAEGEEKRPETIFRVQQGGRLYAFDRGVHETIDFKILDGDLIDIVDRRLADEVFGKRRFIFSKFDVQQNQKRFFLARRFEHLLDDHGVENLIAEQLADFSRDYVPETGFFWSFERIVEWLGKFFDHWPETRIEIFVHETNESIYPLIASQLAALTFFLQFYNETDFEPRNILDLVEGLFRRGTQSEMMDLEELESFEKIRRSKFSNILRYDEILLQEQEKPVRDKALIDNLRFILKNLNRYPKKIVVNLLKEEPWPAEAAESPTEESSKLEFDESLSWKHSDVEREPPKRIKLRGKLYEEPADYDFQAYFGDGYY